MLYARSPKKLLIINILDILRTYTDEQHPLSQRDIIEILERDYAMTAERKAVRRNLMALIDIDPNIEYTETTRIKQNGDTEILYSNWYYRHEFTPSELRLLIDSLLFSSYIPTTQCRLLIDKLKGLSNKYFHPHVRHIANLTEKESSNKQLFYTIDCLNQAITTQKQVRFHYNNYGLDKKLHPVLNKNGTPRTYVINPYQIAIASGRYYLICNHDYFSNVSHYRVERITDIVITDTPARPQQQLEELQHGLNLPRHMAEHIYMFTGPAIHVTFKASRQILNDIIDWFGTEAGLTAAGDDHLLVRVTVNRQAMLYWLMQYGQYTEVLTPDDLREEVLQLARQMVARYQSPQD